MPSPISRTVPTSARSVSTSYSSIRCLRIEVISSGRSFKADSLGGGGQFFTQLLEAAAHARVQAERPRLDDETADERRVDPALGDDAAAGGLLDLLDDALGLLLRELDGGRQLELEHALPAGEQARPLLVHLLELADPVLVHEQAQEVEEELVGISEEILERGLLRARLELRVLEEAAQLVGLLHRRREVVEVLADSVEASVLVRRREQGLGVD